MSASHPIGGERIEHRMRTGELSYPATLAGVVTAVLGLDDRPQVRPHLRAADTATIDHEQYTPLGLARIYRFPEAQGQQQTAAILEFDGGFDPADITAYFGELGIPEPTVVSVSVDGVQNGGNTASAAGETALDIEVLGAVAPGAELRVYFSTWSDSGIVDALAAATFAESTPTVISVSYGLPEEAWTGQALAAIDAALADAAALGITVCVSSGDDGSRSQDPDPGPHVSFPASA